MVVIAWKNGTHLSERLRKKPMKFLFLEKLCDYSTHTHIHSTDIDLLFPFGFDINFNIIFLFFFFVYSDNNVFFYYNYYCSPLVFAYYFLISWKILLRIPEAPENTKKRENFKVL